MYVYIINNYIYAIQLLVYPKQRAWKWYSIRILFLPMHVHIHEFLASCSVFLSFFLAQPIWIVYKISPFTPTKCLLHNIHHVIGHAVAIYRRA